MARAAVVSAPRTPIAKTYQRVLVSVGAGGATGTAGLCEVAR